jgi:hypothetical protein
MNQPNAPSHALFDDRFEDVLLHDPLRSADGGARTEHAICLAVIGRLDPHGFREGLTHERHRVGNHARSDRTNRI